MTAIRILGAVRDTCERLNEDMTRTTDKKEEVIMPLSDDEMIDLALIGLDMNSS